MPKPSPDIAFTNLQGSTRYGNLLRDLAGDL